MCFLPASTDIFCVLLSATSNCCGQVDTCIVNQMIASEDSALKSKANPSVEQFYIGDNRQVKHMPKLVGAKFPNLKECRVVNCGLTAVRSHYFKDMRKVQYLLLNGNQITTIEPGSFRDLVGAFHLWLPDNMLTSLDGTVFDPMINLQLLDLKNNKIKFLSPSTFKIPGGNLLVINLNSNVCIDGGYHLQLNGNQLEANIRANCTR